MTREEAIQRLKTTDACDSELCEALDMAIKALEQQPTDAVSRQAVLDLVADYDLSMGQVVKGIHALPSVTPLPKMGRWNFTKHYGRDYYVCSVCGMERMDDHSSGWNYCPNCGAKMKGARNNVE